MKLKTVLTAAALCVVAATASAHQGPSAGPRMDQGPYVLVDVGHSQQSGMTSAVDEKTSTGVTFGVQLDRTWAVESSLKSFGSRVVASDGTTGRWDAVSVAAVARTPLTRDLDLLGKVGVSHSSISARVSGLDAGVSGTGFVVGAALDYKLDRNWTLRAAYEVMPDFAGTNEPLHNVSVGMKYRF